MLTNIHKGDYESEKTKIKFTIITKLLNRRSKISNKQSNGSIFNLVAIESYAIETNDSQNLAHNNINNSCTNSESQPYSFIIMTSSFLFIFFCFLLHETICIDIKTLWLYWNFKLTLNSVSQYLQIPINMAKTNIQSAKKKKKI